MCGLKLWKTLLFKIVMALVSRKSRHKITFQLHKRGQNVVQRDTARRVCVLPEQKSVTFPANHTPFPLFSSCKLPPASVRIPQLAVFQRLPVNDLWQIKECLFATRRCRLLLAVSMSNTDHQKFNL